MVILQKVQVPKSR